MKRRHERVLLVTHSGDYYTVDRVAAALSRRGVLPLRFNTDEFPTKVRLEGSSSISGIRWRIAIGAEEVLTDEVRAVWLRRLGTPLLSQNLDQSFREVCVSESMAAIRGLLDCLSRARWIDPLSSLRDAEDKVRQLRLAVEVGLTIPATLVTNDASAARDFVKERNGRVITKLIHHPPSSMAATGRQMYTSAVREQDLEQTGALSHSPILLQERVPKGTDLRAIYVDGMFFVGKVETSQQHLDWRRGKPEDSSWTKDSLPREIAQPLTLLMNKLGLSYGAVDLIRTPAGDHVFLEVNSGGNGECWSATWSIPFRTRSLAPC